MRAREPFASLKGSAIAAYASDAGAAMAVRTAASEARRARLQAELAIKARADFLANMNHELRTPLNAIIGFATMLRDPSSYGLADDQRSAYAEYILQSADLLLAHINTLLEAADLDGGAVSLDAEMVDLHETLERAIAAARIAAKAAGVVIDLRPAEGAVVGWGDTRRIAQAVDHVLKTAIKLSSPGARVLARAVVADGGWAEISVRDHSEGLSREAIERALEAFGEVHRGLDRSFAGPGIGYAIAKTFIEIQGGRFAIKSRIGQGTLVQILIPPPRALDNRAKTQSDAAAAHPADLRRTG